MKDLFAACRRAIGKTGIASADASRRGPEWGPHRVTITEHVRYDAVVYGWSAKHVERKAWLLYVQNIPTEPMPPFRPVIEVLDMVVEKVR